MSGLCGWFCGERPGSASAVLIATMAEKLTRFDGSAIRSASANFGALAVAGAGSDIDVFQSEEQLVAVWGRGRFTDNDLAELARSHGIAKAVAQGYANKRTDVLAALSGNFALAILNGRSGEAVLAIDRMGTRPLCYNATGKQLVFGSTLDAINAFPGISPDVDRQAVYDYVHFHVVPGPHTIYTPAPGNLSAVA
jgi:asparagine synthase (glutamine-hydrolysing)